MFSNTFNYKVIYVFQIFDEAHKGILKVGESSLKSNLLPVDLTNNCDALNESARARIRKYTNTIGVQEQLLFTTLAINNKNKIFKDKDVHKVLKNSGIKKHDFRNNKNPEEWFETNLDTIINAINAVKEGRKSLNRNEVIEDWEEIEFRPEQINAIEKTLTRFEVTDKMLWNAKMRFGKTLSTLEVIRRMSVDEKFNLSRALILTHRPVVDENWFNDYKQIFHGDNSFLYGSKRKSTINELLKSNKKFIYFASMQDLRGSERTGGVYLKNDDVFNIDWDLIVIDEAHEGTQTELGKKVLEELLKNDNNHNSKQLHLSGTPFNLLSDFESKDIFTWDYIMEQKSKQEWEINHPFEPNPYDDLPRLNIYTYNLFDFLPGYQDVADKAFNFKEFFRVWTGETEKDGKELSDLSKIGKFIHEDDVKKFLSLLSHESDNNYPFTTEEYRENFRHSFWILPGVKEAKALKELMLQDEVFSLFDIVNVAGSGDNNGDEALEAVYNAIGDKPEENYTITLSCGKLTTGVTVKEWSAVLYLAGSFSTSASSYLQTIFRVQSPCSYGGKQKTDCYVFDFAPDRTLKMIATAGNLSIKSGSTGSKEVMRQFLNFCPVISVDGSEMKPYNVSSMLQELKKAYIQRVVDNGFDDAKIYNDNLYRLDEDALKKFENLKGIVGSSKQTKKINEIEINKQGFTDEEWSKLEKAKRKNKNELTDEQKRLIEAQKEKKKQKDDAISILRGISIRIPLLIYGAEISDDEDITIDNFTDLVDDISWEEFMPRKVTKDLFNDFAKYYDSEIFIGAGRRIRNIAKHADSLNPVERAIQISEIFSTFRNPDKETVLTPWKTVNMHMGDTIGGYNFFDEKYLVTIEEPRLINNGEVTKDILFNSNSKILELNSKTGLYPLYVTISLYKQRCINIDSKKLTKELEKEIWNQIIEDNIFVICKTKMAQAITKRTLIGYKNVNNNIIYEEKIIDELNDNFSEFKSKMFNPITWNKKGDEKMKFDAIIGNPPYQEIISTSEDNASLGKQLFPTFVMSAIKLNSHYVSLITPSRWFAGDAQDKSFLKMREFIKNNNHISKIVNFPDCKDVFDNVAIKGGVSYFLYDKNYTGTVDFVTVESNEKKSQQRNLFEEGLDIILSNSKDFELIKKVKDNNFVSLTTITKGRNAFGIVGKQDIVEKISKKEKFNNSVKLQCKNDEIRWTSSKNVVKGDDVFKKYKVFISKSAGDPVKDKRIIGKPYVAEPYTCCTDSLIPIGMFDTLNEALNLQKYLKSRFVRYFISILKVSQNVYQNVYQFVPLIDFSNNSFVNWNCSIDELDKQLFEKFNFTQEDIEYIDSKVDKVEY